MTRSMKQPRKDVLREQLALAAKEIIRLRALLATADRLVDEGRSALDDARATVRSLLLEQRPRPWWRRLLAWVGA